MKLAIALTFLAIFAGALLLTEFQRGEMGRNISFATIAPVPSGEPQDVLTIYTYDGITSEWGLGPKIFPKFEEKCGCKLNVVAKGDVGAMVSQLIFEKSDARADVVLGIDNTFKQQVAAKDLLQPYEPVNIAEIDASLRGGDSRFIPFDWGYVAFVYDSEKIGRPADLEALTGKQYERKIVIEDPRTSSPGKAFLFWVAQEYGEGTADYLRRLKRSLLTVTPGWTEAYNLFLQGEALIVLSYSTSPAYHILSENTTKFKAAMFPKMYRQIEYVGVARGAKHPELAGQFVQFMLSKDAQEQIPLGNYMYPVRNDVPLPDAFKLTGVPAENVAEIEDGEKWLKIWEEVFSN